jgi:hypothetical protein
MVVILPQSHTRFGPLINLLISQTILRLSMEVFHMSTLRPQILLLLLFGLTLQELSLTLLMRNMRLRMDLELLFLALVAVLRSSCLLVVQRKVVLSIE